MRIDVPDYIIQLATLLSAYSQILRPEKTKKNGMADGKTDTGVLAQVWFW
jgi:hypothetical protein